MICISYAALSEIKNSFLPKIININPPVYKTKILINFEKHLFENLTHNKQIPK